jgi:hypothetical protein
MPNGHGTKPDLKAVAKIGRGEPVGRELAHVSSLLLLKFSVKVVGHNNRISFCGGLWKRKWREHFLRKSGEIGTRP